MAVDVDMKQLRAVGDIATGYKYRVEMSVAPSIGGLSTPPMLNALCQSFTIPKMDAGETIEITSHGITVKQPGIHKPVGTIELKFLDPVTKDMTEWLENYSALCWDQKTGRAYSKAEVESTWILTLQDRNNNDVYMYTLIGAFIEDYDPGGETGSDSSALELSLTLAYDRYEKEKLSA